MTKRVLYLPCMLLLLLAAVKVDSKTLYYDDFDGTKGDWKSLKWPKLETIKVEKEVGNPNNTALTFDTRAAGGASADALFIDGNEDMSDYTMKLRFRIIEETANFAAAGIIVRAPTPQTYICAEAANKRNCCGQNPPNNIVNVFERGDGWPIVANAKVEIPLNKWVDYAVTAKGKSITVYVNDNEVCGYNEALYAKGGFGIRIWKTKVLIDNVEIFDPDGSSLAVDAGGKLARQWAKIKFGD
ncbi:MAG: family 16 glycoside hydrolase [Candidatus Poribacteria bacterium]